MNRVLMELFSLIMACAAAALIGYGIALIRHDRQLRQVIKSVLQDNARAVEELEDANERDVGEQILSLLEVELNTVCKRMGQRI